MKYYKVLAKGRKSCHGGSATWQPGKWMPKIEDIEPCESGYHLVSASQLIEWLGEEIWEAEGRGKRIKQGDKYVFQEARIIRKLDNWNEKTARLFACDCAEDALKYIKDAEIRRICEHTIEVSRRYAYGEATEQELSAARDAAWAAAGAAGAAARDAAWAAARDAARDAAWAAWAAAWAARDAALKKYSKWLLEYLDGEREGGA